MYKRNHHHLTKSRKQVFLSFKTHHHKKTKHILTYLFTHYPNYIHTNAYTHAFTSSSSHKNGSFSFLLQRIKSLRSYMPNSNNSAFSFRLPFSLHSIKNNPKPNKKLINFFKLTLNSLFPPTSFEGCCQNITLT